MIWDVGLGAAANALAAIRALAAGYRRSEDVDAVQFRPQPGGAGVSPWRTRRRWATRSGYEPALRALLDTGAWTVVPSADAKVLWRVVLRDFPRSWRRRAGLSSRRTRFFTIRIRPPSTRRCGRWRLFTALRAGLRDDAPCLLTNYTRSTAVRVTLLLAGFHVGIGRVHGREGRDHRRRERPRAAGAPAGPRAWLENKVYASTNAAPLRAGTAARGPDQRGGFRAAARHPQFAPGVGETR